MDESKFQLFKQSLNFPVEEWEIVYRVHATRRMFERNISEQDISAVLDAGTIIESYDEDTPFPSVLINGKDSEGRHVHLVVAKDEIHKRIYIITTYRPDPSVWEDDFSRRIV